MLTNAQRAKYESVIAATFGRVQKANAKALLDYIGDPPDLSRVPQSFWDKLDAELVTALGPVMVNMAVTSALGLGVSTGIQEAVNWTAINERAARWAINYTYTLVRGVNNTTRDMLRAEIDKFFRQPGEDLDALAKRIQAGGIPALRTRLGALITAPERAKMIAVTEVTRAAAEGEGALVTQIKADNPAVNVVGVWLTSNDEFVCEICRPLNGASDNEGDGNFIHPDTGISYRLPGHPWCRCARGTLIAGL